MTAALVVASHQAGALINDGKHKAPGELFVSIYDEAGAKSYYKDLGITMTDFLDGKGCFDGDLSKDPNFAAFSNGAKDLAYNLAAVNPLVRDGVNNPVNITRWGYLATSSGGESIFNANWSAIDNTQQKIQAYIADLNVVPFTGDAAQQAENKSGIFQSNGIGYHGKPGWGSSMGRSVGGNTEGVPGEALDFYFVNNSNGEASGRQVTKLGAWNLNGNKLSYSGTGTTAICGSSGGAKITLTVAGTGAGRGTISSNPAGISCGTTCSADFDKGALVTLTATPDSASTFKGWSGGGCSGTAACAVTLNDVTSVQAEFAVKDVAPVAGIKLDTPRGWKVREAQTIKWTPTLISPKSKVTVSFSKNGGIKFANLKTLPVTQPGWAWKPAKSHITTNGVIRACVRPDPKKKPLVCDQARVVVQQ
jgi:hypothetical protein